MFFSQLLSLNYRYSISNIHFFVNLPKSNPPKQHRLKDEISRLHQEMDQLKNVPDKALTIL